MTASERLLAHFGRISEGPAAVARLRRFVLDLGVRGKLVDQDPRDDPASLLSEIAAEKIRANRAGHLPAKPTSQGAISAPFPLPSGWAWTTIGEICSKTGSGSTPRGGQASYRKAGVMFLRSQNVQDDGLRLADVAFIEPTMHAAMGSTTVKPGDLLLNITGGSIGRCCRVPDDFDEANVSQHVAIIRVAIDGLQSFLRRLIQSPYFQAFVLSEQTGAGCGGLPKNKMDRIPVALPPIAEQHRIVAKIDELMVLCDRLQAAQKERESRCDRLVSASLASLIKPADDPSFYEHVRFHLHLLPRLTACGAHLDQLRQVIVNLAVRGRLASQDSRDTAPSLPIAANEQPPDGLPNQWRYVSLARLLFEDTRNGYSRKPDEASAGTPILRISASTLRRDGVVAEEEHKLISGIDPDVRLQYGLRAGDLLACRFNGNKEFVGRFALFEDRLRIRAIYPDKLIRVRIAEDFAQAAFIRLASQSDVVRNQIEVLCATTVGNWGISASNLKTVRFPVPPLAEQRRIAAKVDELMAICDHLEAELEASRRTQTALLEATLRHALAQAKRTRMKITELA